MKFIQENLIEFLKQSIYLILKTYKVKLEKESYIKINMRELNEVPNIKCLSYIY